MLAILCRQFNLIKLSQTNQCHYTVGLLKCIMLNHFVLLHTSMIPYVGVFWSKLAVMFCELETDWPVQVCVWLSVKVLSGKYTGYLQLDSRDKGSARWRPLAWDLLAGHWWTIWAGISQTSRPDGLALNADDEQCVVHRWVGSTVPAAEAEG